MLIRNVRVIAPDAILPSRSVLVRDGKIAQVFAAAPPTNLDAAVVDGGGKYLAPGFIDLHIHGAATFSADAGPAAVAGLCRLLPRYGVTGFLPTLCPRPAGEDAAYLASLADVKPDGSAILGFHLEGPFLALTGALPPTLGTCDRSRVEALRRAAGPRPAIFSIAPEVEGIADVLPAMAGGDTPVFITHTRASVAQTQAAVEAGARHATHFYDVFPVPPETEPGARPCGAVEAILADHRASVDFILDGEHVDPVAVRMALACKGPDRVCLITDANVGAGLPPGRYAGATGEDVEFAYEGGPARLTAESHFPRALAGSGLTMDRAVRNARKMLGLSVPQAVRLASLNPAQVLHREDRKGRVAAGYDADLVLLDDDLRVLRTWVGGADAFLA